MNNSLKDNRSGMFYRWVSILLIPVLLSVLLMACSRNQESHDHDQYTCPMHPTVVSDKPGVCPVCAMDLVRKARPGEELEITKELRPLLQSPDEVVISDVRTTKGTFTTKEIQAEISGVVTYDTRKVSTVPVRVGGRLEKVMVKYSLQQVKKGERLFEIYSPELVTAQREFLFVVRQEGENSALAEAAAQRLELLGLSRQQIQTVKSKKDVFYTFPVYSPLTGYVIPEGSALPSAPETPQDVSSGAGGAGMNDGMGGGSGSVSSGPSAPMTPAGPTPTLPREGQYVQRGQSVFTIAGPDALRIEFNLAPERQGLIKVGTKIEIYTGTRDTLEATIEFVEPFFSAGVNFLKVRVYTRRLENLHVGHLVNGKVVFGRREGLFVPSAALLHAGMDNYVFIKEQGVFRARKVVAGVKTEGWVEITEGLASADVIAAEAGFLVDSESFVKPVQN